MKITLSLREYVLITSIGVSIFVIIIIIASHRSVDTKPIYADFDSINYSGKPDSIENRRGVFFFVDRNTGKRYGFSPNYENGSSRSDYWDWLEGCDSIKKNSYSDYIILYKSPFPEKEIKIYR